MAVRTENDIYESAKKKTSKATTGFREKSTGKIRSNNVSIARTPRRVKKDLTSKKRNQLSVDTLRNAKKNKKIRINGKPADRMILAQGIASMYDSTTTSAVLDSYAAEGSGGEARMAGMVGLHYAGKIKTDLKDTKNWLHRDKTSSTNDKQLEKQLNEQTEAIEKQYTKTSSRLERLRSAGTEKDVRKLRTKFKKQEKDLLRTPAQTQKKTLGIFSKKKKNPLSWLGKALKLAFAGVGSVFFLMLLILLGFFIIIMLCGSAAVSESQSYSNLDGNAALIYQYFHEKGVEDVQIAAILGNLKQECGSFDPTIDNGNALGIMQWTGGQRTRICNWASSHGLNVYDLNTQLQYAWEVYIPENWYFAQYTGNHAYPTKYNISFEEWQTTEDIELATGAFCACSEKPYYMPDYDGQSYAMLDTRVQYAEEYLITIRSGIGSGNIPGAEVYNGVPYYNQGDFATYAYDDGTIADSGCGPTSMAMVASYLTGNVISPVDTASWGMANGANSVQTWSAFSLWCDHYGLNLVAEKNGPLYGGDGSLAVENLRSGCLVICSESAGFWTSYGHYIVLTGVTSDGRIYVNDPASRERTNASPYDYGTVFNECKQYWIISK